MQPNANEAALKAAQGCPVGGESCGRTHTDHTTGFGGKREQRSHPNAGSRDGTHSRMWTWRQALKRGSAVADTHLGRIVAALLCGLMVSLLLIDYRAHHDMEWSDLDNAECSCGLAGEYPADCPTSPSGRQDLAFSSFVWFVTDGHPRALAQDLFDAYGPEHAQGFLVDIPGYKFSYAIYTSWVTGKPAKNFAGEPVQGDQLLEALRRAGGHCVPGEDDPGPAHANGRGVAAGRSDAAVAEAGGHGRERAPFDQIWYHGPAWSFLQITAGMEEDGWARHFSAVTLVDESGYHNKDARAYPRIDGEESLLRLLEDAAEAGASLIVHTGTFDKMQHYSRERVPAQSAHINALLGSAKAFFDAHPRYLLLLTSDHGLDVQRGRTHHLHGDGREGNIGYVLAYSPLLPPSVPLERAIDVVDVAATLCTFLGVDVPFGSVGVLQNAFADVEAEKAALRRNVRQLQGLALHRGLSLPRGLGRGHNQVYYTHPLVHFGAHVLRSHRTVLARK